MYRHLIKWNFWTITNILLPTIQMQVAKCLFLNKLSACYNNVMITIIVTGNWTPIPVKGVHNDCRDCTLESQNLLLLDRTVCVTAVENRTVIHCSDCSDWLQLHSARSPQGDTIKLCSAAASAVLQSCSQVIFIQNIIKTVRVHSLPR